MAHKTQQKAVTVAMATALSFAVFAVAVGHTQPLNTQKVNITNLTQTLNTAKNIQTPEEIAAMLKVLYQANPAAFTLYLTNIIKTVPEAAPALMTKLKTVLLPQEQNQIFTQVVSTLQTANSPKVQRIAQQLIAENTDILAQIQQSIAAMQPAAGQLAEAKPKLSEASIMEEEKPQSAN